MKRRLFLGCLAALLILSRPLPAAEPAKQPGVTAVTPALVTASTIESRLKEVEASNSLDEATRTALTDILNKALGNLEMAAANQTAADNYAGAVKAAPQQAREIREQLEQYVSTVVDYAGLADTDWTFRTRLWQHAVQWHEEGPPWWHASGATAKRPRRPQPRLPCRQRRRTQERYPNKTNIQERVLLRQPVLLTLLLPLCNLHR